jgi:hypothetical protein
MRDGAVVFRQGGTHVWAGEPPRTFTGKLDPARLPLVIAAFKRAQFGTLARHYESGVDDVDADSKDTTTTLWFRGKTVSFDAEPRANDKGGITTAPMRLVRLAATLYDLLDVFRFESTE